MLRFLKQHPLKDAIAIERHHLFMAEVGSRMIASVLISFVVGFLFISSHDVAKIVQWFSAITIASVVSFIVLRDFKKIAINSMRNPSTLGTSEIF